MISNNYTSTVYLNQIEENNKPTIYNVCFAVTISIIIVIVLLLIF